ncbi:diiron oxygenase [Sesbania bispinosa]|nr:diiron oxygenase [Sesbania bispinosa]
MALMIRRIPKIRRRGKPPRNRPRRSPIVRARFRRRRLWILPMSRIPRPRACMVSLKMIRGRRRGRAEQGILQMVLMPEGGSSAVVEVLTEDSIFQPSFSPDVPAVNS